jgi:hypothetical protein
VQIIQKIGEIFNDEWLLSAIEVGIYLKNNELLEKSIEYLDK